MRAGDRSLHSVVFTPTPHSPHPTPRLHHASILGELDQMRRDLDFRSPMKPRIEVGIDALAHRRSGCGAGCKRIENLPLALKSVCNILRNQGGGIIARGTVGGEDAFGMVREKNAQ